MRLAFPSIGMRASRSDTETSRQKFPGSAATVAPFAVCVIISAAFLAWFGWSTARLLENDELAKQSESVSLLNDYLQHLIDDALVNLGTLADDIAAAPASPNQQQLSAFWTSAKSRGHTRAAVLFDGQGQPVAKIGTLPPSVAAQLPEIAARLNRNDAPIFLPVAAADERGIPGFLLAAHLAAQTNIVFDTVANLQDRRANLDVASFDAAFAMVDTVTGTTIRFGGSSVGPTYEGKLADLARTALSGDGDGSALCHNNGFLGRECISFHRLRNSSLVLFGVTDHARVVSRWIQQSRPVWLFAAFVMIGGLVSSALIYLWARQRQADRSRLSSALEETRQAYAAKSNFMAHLCHELRTPLNSIVGFSDLMRSALFGPLDERYRTYSEDIHASAVHLHNIASDIMDVERMERGELALEPGVADLNLVIAHVARMLSVLAAKHSIDLELRPLPEPAVIRMNPHRATQIAVNLVSNAVKYSEPGDRVTVSVERTTGDAISLKVADEGIGMTAEEISYSEHPFGHPAERRVGRHDSIGLGLPIVRGLLAGVGGRLHITSEKHKGTIVTAIFGPTEAPEAATAHRAPRRE